VVSTNALELGIDIGSLEACVMTGYPGTIASTWQQAGRAGRGQKTAVAVLVASSSGLDQYIVSNPDYFFGQSPELGLIHPNNLYILLSHIKCAAFELPFAEDEQFGVETTRDILEFLEEQGVLRHVGNRFHWMADHFPAEDISLRSAAQDNFVIIDRTRAPRVIGEVDRFSAPLLIHEEAVYLHESQQYQVEELDYDEKKAYVKQVDVDYYTDANLAVTIKPLDVFEEATEEPVTRAHGEVLVTAKATIFKKIKFHTHENVGWGKIHLPEEQMHTMAYWFSLGERVRTQYSKEQLEAGLQGLSNLVQNVAPLYLMCDPRDIGTVAQVRSPFTHLPTLFVYDSLPGGVGFGERLFHLHDEVIAAAWEVVSECPCAQGCPSCVGPFEELGPHGKSTALLLLEEVLQAGEVQRTPARGLVEKRETNGHLSASGDLQDEF
jgi:DEAD/DEAH box helicase domain-containing protein